MRKNMNRFPNSSSHSQSMILQKNILSSCRRHKLDIPLSYSRYKKQTNVDNQRDQLNCQINHKQKISQSSDSSELVQSSNNCNINTDCKQHRDIVKNNGSTNINITLKREIQKASLKKIWQRQIIRQKELSETILKRQQNCHELQQINKHINHQNTIIRKYIHQNQLYKKDKKTKMQKIQQQLRKTQQLMAQRKKFVVKWQQQSKEIQLKQMKHLQQDIKKFEVFFDGLRQSIDILKGNNCLKLSQGSSLANLWQNWKKVIEKSIAKQKA